MSFDALNFVLPQVSFSDSLHLLGPSNPSYGLIDQANRRVWYLKTDKGWPGDCNYWDADFVYQWLTENDKNWANNSYKRFISKNWVGGGIPWCRRQLNAGWNAPIITTDSSFQRYQACKLVSTESVSTVMTQAYAAVSTSGEDWSDYGPPFGKLPSLVIQYLYNPGFTAMERFYYAQPYGWLNWELYSLANGIYSLVKSGLPKQIVSGGTPALNFACTLA